MGGKRPIYLTNDQPGGSFFLLQLDFFISPPGESEEVAMTPQDAHRIWWSIFCQGKLVEKNTIFMGSSKICWKLRGSMNLLQSGCGDPLNEFCS